MDSCVKERLRSGTSSTAQALHMRQQAYDALAMGQTQQDSSEAAANSPASEPQRQSSGSQHRDRESSASGRRARQTAAGRVSSVDSALAEARSFSLHATTSPEAKSAASDGNHPEGAPSTRKSTAIDNSDTPEAAVATWLGHEATSQHPEAALMAARKLVGHAIFALEVRCSIAD